MRLIPYTKIFSVPLLAMALIALIAGKHPVQADSFPNNFAPVEYSQEEIVTKGHTFFGKTTGNLAQAIESLFAKFGKPTAYITGEEASGAIVAGLRYGEGTFYMKEGTSNKVYWQGPSVGFDLGGNASRTMTLVYKLTQPEQLFRSYAGAEGTAYIVAGVGINVQERDGILIASIRTGVGARLGFNFGYLKYTQKPTWNPF